MGEGQSKVQSRLLSNPNPLIQQYLAPKPQVSPYRDGMPNNNNNQVSILQVIKDKNKSRNNTLNASYSYGGNDQSRFLSTNREPILKGSLRKELRGKFGTDESPEQAILISEAYGDEDNPFHLDAKSQYIPKESVLHRSQTFSRQDDRDRREFSPPRDPRDDYSDGYSRSRGSPGGYDNRQPQMQPKRMAHQPDYERSSYREDRMERNNYGEERMERSNYREDRMERSRSPELRTRQSYKDERGGGGGYQSRTQETRGGFQYRNQAEEKFSEEEVEILRGNFDAYSKDNRLSEYNLLKLLSLEDFEKSFIGNRIYNCIKQISAKGATFGNYVNYERYIQAMAILARGTIQERLDFIYNIFDPRGEGRVTWEEMNIVIGDLFRILRATKFEHNTLNVLSEKISEIDEDEIDSILEELIKEIFAMYANDPNYLTFEEWKSWFMSQFGMTDVLNFKIKRIEI